jgi:hypothetical protein
MKRFLSLEVKLNFFYEVAGSMILFLSVADNIATRLNTATNLDNNLYDNDF